MAISRFTSDALAAAADERWYPESGAPHKIERLLWQPPRVIFRYPQSTELHKEPGIDFLIDTGRWSERKAAAIRAYRTQGLGKLFFEHPDGRRTFSTEAFRVGWGTRPKSVPAGDLFAE